MKNPVTVTFDWANHQHVMETQSFSTGSDCYSSSYDAKVCALCTEAATQSKIPFKEHHTHPKGCLCRQCVDCRCEKIKEREGNS